MSKSLKVTIVTPDKKAVSYEAEYLKTNTKGGEIEFRYNHTPIIVGTIPATTVIKVNDKIEYLFTSSGILYLKNNELKFCCDSYEISSEIDEIRANQSKQRAEERLSKVKDIDIERAKRALARANARISTIKKNI